MTGPARHGNERGFVLIGAVMFVLVLTILALSLFSLSSFEGQFMRDATDRSAAYNAALGGLDRARFALGRTSTLASVSSGLPVDSVVYVVARQNADTSGTVFWSGPNANDVTIRVKARYGGEVRFVEARYVADRNRSFYRNLMTLSSPDSGLFVYRIDSRDLAVGSCGMPDSNYKATYLNGIVRQNAPNSPDRILPLGFPPHFGNPPVVALGGALQPNVGPYIAHYAGDPGTSNVNKQPGTNPYVLNALGDPDSIRFFRTPGPDGSWSLDMRNEPRARIRVSGTCVWMFDKGLRVERTLEVEGSGRPQPNNDMLVLVGGSQALDGDDPSAGLALLGSIHSPDVPIVLISDGMVLVEHRDFGGTWTDDNNPSVVGCMSIFARSAFIMGPDHNCLYDTGSKTIFSHPENHPGNDIIDRLVEMGCLPNTQGLIKGKLSPVAGTWREVTEANPVFP